MQGELVERIDDEARRDHDGLEAEQRHPQPVDRLHQGDEPTIADADGEVIHPPTVVWQVCGPEDPHVVRQAMVPIEVVIVRDDTEEPDIPRETQGGIAQVLLAEGFGQREEEHVQGDLEHVGDHADHRGAQTDHETGQALLQIEEVLGIEIFHHDQHEEDRIHVLDADPFNGEIRKLGFQIQPRLDRIETHEHALMGT